MSRLPSIPRLCSLVDLFERISCYFSRGQRGGGATRSSGLFKSLKSVEALDPVILRLLIGSYCGFRSEGSWELPEPRFFISGCSSRRSWVLEGAHFSLGKIVGSSSLMTPDKLTPVSHIPNKLSAVRSCGPANVTAASETLMQRSLLATMANWIWLEFGVTSIS